MISFARPDPTSQPWSGEGVTQLAESARGLFADARRYLVEVRDKIETMTTNQPELALGVALAVGVYLGWIIKRR